MRTAKKVIFKILPIIITTVVAMSLIFLIYLNVLDSETENCWERLDDGVTNLSVRVKRSFGENLNLLGRVADAMPMQDEFYEIDEVLDYIKSVRENTIYQRIDILYPNNELLTEDGNVHTLVGQIPFSELEKKGTHISSRYTDHFHSESGCEVIYCTAPIVKEGETTALLIGVIECDDLKNYFSLNLYGNRSQIFVIDRTDGKFIVDNWHDTLGDLSDIGRRDRLPEYDNVNFAEDIKNGNKGRFAFVSKQNGKVSYMTYSPVDDDKFQWTVAVMVQEDIAMENVSRLSGYMRIVAVIITICVMMYIVWNTVIVSRSVKNEEQVRAAEIEKEKTKTKSVFLSSMSHDIRTPLNGIIGMLEIIDKNKDDKEKIEDCLSKIKVSANYLVTLADDILDINEMESGKLVLIDQPFNILSLIDKINIIINSRATDADINYHVNCAGIEYPDVFGSEPHIQRILINLIGNAIKYNKPHGDVWLLADEVSENGETLYRFTVIDNGIGMSEDFQKNMFVAFEQENSGARTTNRGHGLGLTIVHRLVSEMNGRIDVESRLGEGTTFTVTLPLKKNVDSYIAEKKKSLSKKEDHSLLGMNILLAEDNDLNMEIAKSILTEAGAEIITSVNGREALEVFSTSSEWSISLILMDIMMPEMDGLEATRAIRALERNDAKNVPIIAMSAAAFADDIRLAENAGMNGHISKPLDSKLLLETLSKYRR